MLKKLSTHHLVKKAGILVGMWLVPGPIIIPIVGYLIFKWKKRKTENPTQTEASSSQTP